MDFEMRKATESEYLDLIDFARMVFNVDFPALLPKLYSGHPETASCHLMALEEGRIRAMVGSFPLRLRVAEERLQVKGIGTVSVHPDTRGKGYMKDIMARCVSEAREEGAQLMCLGGQRQRYEYFGFGKGASYLSYVLTPTNRRHCKAISTKTIEILPLHENREYIADCQKLHSAQSICADRPIRSFMEILESWSCEAFVVLENGSFLGYASIHKEKNRVQELILKHYESALPVVFRIVELCGKEVSFGISSYQQKLAKALGLVAESITVSGGEMINILDYKGVIKAYLTLKSRETGVMDGSYVIDVKEQGRYEITVLQGEVSASDTEKPANLSLPHLQMMERLFFPANFLLQEGTTQLEKSWFPIPIYLPQADMV